MSSLAEQNPVRHERKTRTPTIRSKHIIFAPPEMKMFDFCVRPRAGGFDVIFARVWVGAGAPPPETGLWWCRAEHPSSALSQWSAPVQIMTANDCGWHSGPWKPSFQFGEQASDRRSYSLTDRTGPEIRARSRLRSLSAAVK
jgi:hypothetical protein